MTKTARVVDRERIFVFEFLKDFDGARASIEAGYRAKIPSSMGSKLLRRPSVQKLLAEEREKLRCSSSFDLQTIATELAKIGFSNIADFTRLTADGERVIDLSETSREQLAAISELTVEDYTDGRGEDSREVKRVKVKFHPKVEALDKLVRMLGISKEKQAVVNQTTIIDNRQQTLNAITPQDAAKEYLKFVDGE